MGADAILAGFSNASLISVLALLVMGQALIQTDTLRLVTGIFALAKPKYAMLALAGVLITIMILSAFVNNTPLVVIAIPLVQMLANTSGTSESRMMLPLSYVAILGGMTTLIGSSTNLLVSSKMREMGYEGFAFFDFVIPGALLAVAGLIYIAVILPYLLKDRAGMAKGLIGAQKEFVAELEIAEGSKLIGTKFVEDHFSGLQGLNVRMIQRGGQLILAPFDAYEIAAGDVLIGSADRKVLSKVLARHPGSFLFDEYDPIGENDTPDNQETRVLAEIMVTPASRCLDMTLELAALDEKYGITVLGIQRKARIVRRRMSKIRLAAGDVLLVAGTRSKIYALRNNTDFIVLSGSKRDLPTPAKAPLASLIFVSMIACATLGVLSIPVAAISGAVLMVLSGCLNFRQALRAVDRKIYLLVASMLALGTAMQATGGVDFIAKSLLHIPVEHSAFALLSALFLIIAILTNLLSNNACAVLFTPIAMNLAESVHILPNSEYNLSYIFAITVIFGANCSFASPMGYQTNLLVMGPGHYRFSDFIRAGVPLIGVMWGAYMLLLKFYFGI